jgi:hypothetical protein
MAVCTSGLEGLNFPSLSCIAPVGVTLVALGVHKRLWRCALQVWKDYITRAYRVLLQYVLHWLPWEIISANGGVHFRFGRTKFPELIVYYSSRCCIGHSGSP